MIFFLVVDNADAWPSQYSGHRQIFILSSSFLFQQVQVRKNLPADFQKLTSAREQETRGIQSEPMPHGKKEKILSSTGIPDEIYPLKCFVAG